LRFCQPHWEKMKAAVEARGLSSLVAESGLSAATNMISEITEGQTIDNFDPLMAVHWIMLGNIQEKLGQAALYLYAGGPEDAIDVEQLTDPALKAKYAWRTWPRCPLCYINIAHEFSCSNPNCSLERVNGYDIAIEWSADGAKEQLVKLMDSKTTQGA
jgi:hypothetical protein